MKAINWETMREKFRLNSGATSRESDASIEDGRREGENENPYLSARRTWNDHMRAVAASRNMWQLLAILALMIALAAVGGVIHVGSQSKFIPYVVQVDKLGEAVAVSRADTANPTDSRVIHASVASFIADLRMVTPDVALQRRAVFRAYALLSPNDPATAKTNEWLNGSKERNPFKRAATETVSVEIISVIPQSLETWQVDWIENVFDRKGQAALEPFRMRALLTIYTVEPTTSTTEEQIRNNPLGIYVRDFSWSKLL